MALRVRNIKRSRKNSQDWNEKAWGASPFSLKSGDKRKVVEQIEIQLRMRGSECLGCQCICGVFLF